MDAPTNTLTREQLLDLARSNCPHCDIGRVLRYREETDEYVHDWVQGAGFSHTICLSNGMRRRYKATMESGNGPSGSAPVPRAGTVGAARPEQT